MAHSCLMSYLETHSEYNVEKGPFWQDNALFASKAKINVFWKKFEWRVPKGDWSEEIFFKKR